MKLSPPSSNPKFGGAVSNIVLAMSDVKSKCAEYIADYAQGKEETELKKMYDGINKSIICSNAKIATEVKKYIQQKMNWTADIDKYKFYFAVIFVCIKNDPGMGLCGRAMHAEFARLPLPNTAKHESE